MMVTIAASNLLDFSALQVVHINMDTICTSSVDAQQDVSFLHLAELTFPKHSRSTVTDHLVC